MIGASLENVEADIREEANCVLRVIKQEAWQEMLHVETSET